MKNFQLTAPILRIILSITLVLITIVGFFIWQTGHNIIANLAGEVAKTNQNATSSANDLSELQSLQSQLDAHKGTAAKAVALIAESKNYQYQNQLTQDLQTFASAAGVTIQSYTYASSSASGGAGSAVPTGTISIAGLKTVTVTVGLGTPLDYNSYLQFINDIQNNGLHMQVTGLSLSASNGGNLSSEALTVTAFTQ